MNSNTVVAVYRPLEGKTAEFESLIARHVALLREEGLVESRPVILLRSQDGSYLEIFDWAEEGVERAHSHPKVKEIWGEMEKVSEFRTLSQLKEAEHPFPHFERVEGLLKD